MSNQTEGLEQFSLYIPLDDDTRAERKGVVADAELELQGYERQINDFKKKLQAKTKAAKERKAKALLELKTNQFELSGEFFSYVNEIRRTMEYYDPVDRDVLVASRPLTGKEIRQFKLDFREQIAQN